MVRTIVVQEFKWDTYAGKQMMNVESDVRDDRNLAGVGSVENRA